MPEDVMDWRYQHELTQLQMADLLMVSVLTIKRWEYGQRQPPWFLKLALERLDQLLLEEYVANQIPTDGVSTEVPA